MAKSMSLVTSLTHQSTFLPKYSSINDLDSRVDPKCLWTLIVTLIEGSLNTSLATCFRFGLMINQHFLTLESNSGEGHSSIVCPTISSRLAWNHF